VWPFGSSKLNLVCPYCLQRIRIPSTTTHCPESDCKQEIPRFYKKEHKQLPVLFIPIIGWTRVGKTVFLQVLTLLMERLGKIWPEFLAEPDTQVTFDFVQQIRAALASGVLPEGSSLGVHEAYIMLMKKMERWGGRTLVFRDCAGENFKDATTIPAEQVPFLKRSRTVMMMFSMPDLLSPAGQTDRILSMDELLHSYIRALDRHGVDVKQERRNLIVVLSKADQMPTLPEHLQEYLTGDPIWAALSSPRPPYFQAREMALYVEEMDRASQAIREYLDHETDTGHRLIRLAEEHRMRVRFCVLSSLGGPVNQQNRLIEQLRPSRVLDPLFSALEFEK
jgi:hypothetical protein